MSWTRPRRFENALPLPLFSRLCARATALAEAGDSTSTFWGGLVDQRRTSLGVAVDRLSAIAPPLGQCLGVEWWVRQKPRYASMALHFDKDEARAARGGEIRHPDFASVLYLTDDGGPTLVLDQQLRDGKCCECRRGFLSPPARNAFLIFPGDWRHGVVAEQGADLGAGNSGAVRATLLLNWWRVRPMAPSCRDLDNGALGFFDQDLDENHKPFETGLIALDEQALSLFLRPAQS